MSVSWRNVFDFLCAVGGHYCPHNATHKQNWEATGSLKTWQLGCGETAPETSHPFALTPLECDWAADWRLTITCSVVRWWRQMVLLLVYWFSLDVSLNLCSCYRCRRCRGWRGGCHHCWPHSCFLQQVRNNNTAYYTRANNVPSLIWQVWFLSSISPWSHPWNIKTF